jgi:hypothetical protein
LTHGGTPPCRRRTEKRPICAELKAKPRSATLAWARRCTPTGNPMLDGVGPASYCRCAPTVPDLTATRATMKIVPLRAAPGFYLESA